MSTRSTGAGSRPTRGHCSGRSPSSHRAPAAAVFSLHALKHASPEGAVKASARAPCAARPAPRAGGSPRGSASWRTTATSSRLARRSRGRSRWRRPFRRSTGGCGTCTRGWGSATGRRLGTRGTRGGEGTWRRTCGGGGRCGRGRGSEGARDGFRLVAPARRLCVHALLRQSTDAAPRAAGRA